MWQKDGVMSQRAEVRCVGLVRTAALLVLLACTSLSPRPASAQLGGLIVTVTSPASGSTVGATITVSASVNPAAMVRGVQFTLNGANLGAEDTTAPYATSWNTTTASNGSHTLRAVARDALGLRFTSDPVVVTVFNDTTPPTVAITSPSSGSTVSGTISVSASASDNVGVAGVQFQLDGAPLGTEDTTAPYSVTWDTRTAAPGTHTLRAIARDAAGNTGTSFSIPVTVSNGSGVGSGDVFVALIDGRVQWHSPDGSLQRTLSGISDGEASGIAFDATRNLYVPHWYSRIPLAPGNTVAQFDDSGNLLGTFGSGYDCNPSSFAFDAAGNVYVGQADCTGDILKFDAAGNRLASFNAATGVRGADHIDLASDGCTMFYSAWTQDILRFDVCTNAQLPRFNTQPLPGETAYHLRILPDGGVLVADTQAIVRLDAFGNQVRTYEAPGGPNANYWTGLDIPGDGTFWAVNALNANIWKFDLDSGAVLGGFNAGTGPWTAIGVAVKP